MILKTLVENTTSGQGIKSKHGISFYIETNGRKILFDTGPNNLFIKNAEKMNVPLSEIDDLIISHGHVDHGGGLAEFLKINPTAKIYIREEAFDKHFTKILGLKIDVGLNEKLKTNPQIIFTKDLQYINDEVILFSNVTERKFYPESNNKLFKKVNGADMLDDFSHEQNLIVKDGGKNILISGCSHMGIVNIIEKGKTVINHDFDTVIGGFHLYNPVSRKKEKKDLIHGLTKALLSYDSIFYTCHCTGKSAYDEMKLELKDQLHYLSAGSSLHI